MQAKNLTADGSQDCLRVQTRAAAFRSLLESGEPVAVPALAAALGHDVSKVEEALGELEREGLVRREGGRIVGSFGLSVVPSRDEIHVEGRRFWTWCAKTSLGVLGALGRGGQVVSQSPVSGRELRLAFEGSRPVTTDLVVFWPSREFADGCSSTVEDLCPSINFFESAATAERWASTSLVPGEVLPVEEATERAIKHWAPLVVSAEPPGTC